MRFACCPECGRRIEKYSSNTLTGNCSGCNKEVKVSFTNDMDVYYGFLTEKSELKKSASGGAGTILARQFILQGGVVVGVRWKENFKGAVYTYIDNPDNVGLLSGSKYIDVDRMMPCDHGLKSVFAVVGDFLSSDRNILFFGLGCDVFALKSYLRKKSISDEKLFTVDLLCGGTTDRAVMEQYTEYLERKFKSPIQEFSVRYKEHGWAPPYLRAKFQNGRIFKIPFFHSEFGYAFNHMKKEGCYNCRFKGANHLSDLTIGDYWGCDKHSSVYNPMGMSIMFVQNEKGKKILGLLKEDCFAMGEADFESGFKDNNFFGGKKKSSKYSKYKEAYDRSDIFAAMRETMGLMKYLIIKTPLMAWREILVFRTTKK